MREAGEIARKYFGGDYKRWNKAGGSPVTEADLAVDTFLNETLLRGAARLWLAVGRKRGRSRAAARPRVFVVDPIDGTVAFLKGRPHFTICAAVVEEGRPIAGVVLQSRQRGMFHRRSRAAARASTASPSMSATATAIEGCRMLGDRKLFRRTGRRCRSQSLQLHRLSHRAGGRRPRIDAMISLTAKRDWDLAAADMILCGSRRPATDAGRRDAASTTAPHAIQRATIAAGPGLHAACCSRMLRQKESLRSRGPIRPKYNAAHVMEIRHAQAKSKPKQLLHLVFGGELKSHRRHRVQGSHQARHRRHVSQFRRGQARLGGQGAGHRGQCPDALFRGPYSPADGAGRRRDHEH